MHLQIKEDEAVSLCLENHHGIVYVKAQRGDTSAYVLAFMDDGRVVLPVYNRLSLEKLGFQVNERGEVVTF